MANTGGACEISSDYSNIEAVPLPPFDSGDFSGEFILPENILDDGDFDFDFSFDDLPPDLDDFLLDPVHPEVDQRVEDDSRTSNPDDCVLDQTSNSHEISADQKFPETIPTSRSPDLLSSQSSGTDRPQSPDSITCNDRKRKKEDEDEKSSSKSRRSGEDGEDEKRKARLMRNRESAQLSRQRKKHYVEELEEKVRSMHATIQDLNGRISYFMAENASLKQQISGGSICHPPPGMYPHPSVPAMAYPWMPCAPYVIKSKGSQGTPLVPIPRLKPQQTKEKDKKNAKKTKKVASVSFLGVVFFLFLFGCLVPMVNLKYSTESSTYNRFRENSSYNEPLTASLYVPRNDKLVKIDGNLIIHSVLASNKAMDTRLAIAASSSSSSSSFRHLQQWFREGLAGPMLRSGVCKEVFQFDVSPNAIVAASSSSATSLQQDRVSKTMKNRRILGGLNATDQIELETTTNKSVSSSMVVSVLVDPREAGEIYVDGRRRYKSISRIFVVVLIDSVRYVTYSCVLPVVGSGPHLMANRVG